MNKFEKLNKSKFRLLELGLLQKTVGDQKKYLLNARQQVT